MLLAKKARGAADAGSRGRRSCRAKSGSRAQNRSNVAGILDTGENDQQRSACGIGRAHESSNEVSRG